MAFTRRRGTIGALLLAAAGAALLVILADPATPPLVLPVLAQQPAAASCEAYCSGDRPGVSVIELRWPVSTAPMGAAAVRAAAANQSLEVTVYDDGFERGLFARVGAVQPKAGFRAAVAPGAAEQRIPGIARLVVAEVATTQDRGPAGRFRLMAAGPQGSAPDSMFTRIEGVEPGLNYSWRVPSPSGPPLVLTCQAATCPVDRRTAPQPAAPKPAAKTQLKQ